MVLVTWFNVAKYQWSEWGDTWWWCTDTDGLKKFCSLNCTRIESYYNVSVGGLTCHVSGSINVTPFRYGKGRTWVEKGILNTLNGPLWQGWSVWFDRSSVGGVPGRKLERGRGTHSVAWSIVSKAYRAREINISKRFEHESYFEIELASGTKRFESEFS